MPYLVGIMLLFVLVVAGTWFLVPAAWSRILISTARRRCGLRSRILTVEGIRWHFLEGGRGHPLMLLHGFGANADSWLRMIPILRHRFRLIIPDLAGFGDSERPENLEFDITTQATRLQSLLDALDVKAVFLAGHSMGGYVATELARRSPSVVVALGLLAPLGVRSAKKGQFLQSIDDGDPGYIEISDVAQFRTRIQAPMFHTQTWIPSPIVRTLVARAASSRDQAARMLYQARFESPALEDIAGEVDCPVLVLWGTEDPVVDCSGLDVLLSSFPRARGKLIGECSHLPLLEKPSLCARELLEFFDSA